MGNATPSQDMTNFSHNHADRGAWQHNGNVYGGAVYNFHGQEGEETTSERQTRLENEKEDMKVQAILQNLSFPEMDVRRQAIPDAATKTFNWLLQEVEDWSEDVQHNLSESWDRRNLFREWLTSVGPCNLFWISGKAGSGKSTLMKFICNHRQTRSCLQSWATTRRGKLFTAHHFFWFAGSHLQKSRQGLLQTLLMQLCRADRSLMRILCHESFSSPDEICTQPWSTSELWDCLKRLRHVPDAMFCLFVDGLDEFAPSDGHTQLAQDVLELSAISNVKLCVSSRPWPAFEDHFVFRARCPAMKLQDLTRYDLRQFAIAQMEAAFTSNEVGSVKRIETDEKGEFIRRYGVLIDNLIKKSKGVFLWVRLVVASLCERMQAGATPEELNTCLKEFPSELEAYLRHMVYDRIGPTWKSGSETAKCLQLALLLYGRRSKLSNLKNRDATLLANSLLYHLAMQRVSWSWDAVRDYPYASIAAPMNGKRLAAWELKIESSCQGLLSIQRKSYEEPCCGSVDFSHRCVFDFLVSEEMQTLLKDNVPAFFYYPDFVHMLLVASCKIAVMASRFQYNIPHYHRKHTFPLLKLLQVEDAKSVALENLEQTAIDLDHKNGLPGLLQDHQRDRGEWGSDKPMVDFLTRLLQKNLFRYVHQTVAEQPHLAMVFNSRNLLRDLRELHGKIVIPKGLESSIARWLDLVTLLVNNGADSRSYWQMWQDMLDCAQKVDQNQGAQFICNVWKLSWLLISNGILSFIPICNQISSKIPVHASDWGEHIGLRRCAAAGGLDNDALKALLMKFSNPVKVEEIHNARLEVRKRLWPEFRQGGKILYRAWHMGEEKWIRHTDQPPAGHLHTIPADAEHLPDNRELRDYDLSILSDAQPSFGNLVRWKWQKYSLTCSSKATCTAGQDEPHLAPSISARQATIQLPSRSRSLISRRNRSIYEIGIDNGPTTREAQNRNDNDMEAAERLEIMRSIEEELLRAQSELS